MAHPTPPKLTLVNTDTSERLSAQFNPEELELALKPVWNKQVIPGMSHTQGQFSHTDNMSVRFDLRFKVSAPKYGVVTEAERALARPTVSTYSTTRDLQNLTNRETPPTDNFTHADFEKAQNFLLALCVPRGANSVARNSPPNALVVWPNFLSFEARVIDASFKYTRFNRNARPVEMTASLSMEQVRVYRYTSEDIRRQGLKIGTNPWDGTF